MYPSSICEFMRPNCGKILIICGFNRFIGRTFVVCTSHQLTVSFCTRSSPQWWSDRLTTAQSVLDMRWCGWKLYDCSYQCVFSHVLLTVSSLSNFSTLRFGGSGMWSGEISPFDSPHMATISSILTHISLTVLSYLAGSKSVSVRPIRIRWQLPLKKLLLRRAAKTWIWISRSSRCCFCYF